MLGRGCWGLVSVLFCRRSRVCGYGAVYACKDITIHVRVGPQTFVFRLVVANEQEASYRNIFV